MYKIIKKYWKYFKRKHSYHLSATINEDKQQMRFTSYCILCKKEKHKVINGVASGISVNNNNEIIGYSIVDKYLFK